MEAKQLTNKERKIERETNILTMRQTNNRQKNIKPANYHKNNTLM